MAETPATQVKAIDTTADGQMVLYQGTDANGEVESVLYSLAGPTRPNRIPGFAQISRNGRYVLTWVGWRGYEPRQREAMLFYLHTGNGSALPEGSRFAERLALTDDGRVALTTGMWSPMSGLQELSLPAGVPMVSPSGRWILSYKWTRISDNKFFPVYEDWYELSLVDVETGLVSAVGQGLPLDEQNVDSAAFVRDQTVFAFGQQLIPLGSGTTPGLAWPASVRAFRYAMAGNGEFAWVSDSNRHISRVGLTTGEVVEVLPTVASLQLPAGDVGVPGSPLEVDLVGRWPTPHQIEMEQLLLPVIKLFPEDPLCYSCDGVILPPELEARTYSARASAPGAGPFEDVPVAVKVVAYQPYFVVGRWGRGSPLSRPVAGGLVRFRMAGLGVPEPRIPRARLTVEATGQSFELEVLRPEPWANGIYDVPVRLPEAREIVGVIGEGGVMVYIEVNGDAGTRRAWFSLVKE